MKISSGDLPPLSRKRGQGEYTSLLHQELARNEAPVLDEHGRLPGVLPIVLYNGEAPWQSALEVSELSSRWTKRSRRIGRPSATGCLKSGMSGKTNCRGAIW